MTTGDDVRRARGRLNLTQRQLADMAGVSLRSVSTWEALGDTDIPVTAEGRLSEVLQLAAPAPPSRTVFSLADVSDIELIAELARRMGERASNG